MRLEVRVCANEDAWEVRIGEEGATTVFRSQWAALEHARGIARLAWTGQGLLSAVRIRTSADLWETDSLYGGESGGYRGG
jgi:hypothetical protein